MELRNCQIIMERNGRHPFANLSESQRGQIIGLYEAGEGRQSIADIVGCSKKTVSVWIGKYEEGGHETLKDHKKYNARLKKTLPEQDEEIVQFIDANPFVSAAAVLNDNNIPISERTVRRRLNAAKIRSHTPAKKVALTEAHRNQRIEYARQHFNTPQEDWNQIIWLDEKVFSSSEDGRRRVWRPDGQRLNPKYVIPSKHSGRITLGFWGSMTSMGLMDIIEITPHMDVEEYVEILEEVLKPSARRIFSEEQYPTLKIVQDNSSVHSSRMVQEWFYNNPDFQLIPWPAKSPDLNAIKNVWSMMQKS